MKTLIFIVACIVLFPSISFGAGGVFTHRGMVAASGIRPNQVGTHEGVGMSSRSFEDARNHACYWGRRTPVSIQYSKRGGNYYAVVRYR